jgi:hypothetical protein
LKTDKLRKAQSLLRDLQSGHTLQVSTWTDDKLHGAITSVIEFRAIRRSLKKTTTAFHADILATAKKLFPDRSLATFDTIGLLKLIQANSFGYSSMQSPSRESQAPHRQSCSLSLASPPRTPPGRSAVYKRPLPGVKLRFIDS